MSDYIANAFVRVLPDSTGFRAALSKEIREAVGKIPLSARSVLVVPKTTGFQAALRTQVREEITKVGPQSVPITPTLTSFRANFAAELRKEPVEIPVFPDMEPFLAQLRAQVAAANKGLQVTIPVVTGDLSGASKLDQVARQAVSTNALLSKVEDERAKSRVRVNRALNEGISLEARERSAASGLRTLEAQLLKVEEALAVAKQRKAVAGIQALEVAQRELTSDIKFVATQHERIAGELKLAGAKKKGIATSVAKTEVELQEALAAAELTRVEGVLTGIEKTRATAARDLSSALNADIPLRQRLVELERAAAPLKTVLAQAEREFGAAIAANNIPLANRLKSIVANIKSETQLSFRQRAKLIQLAAETEVLGVNIKTLKTKAEVTKVETALTRLSTAAQEQEAVARRAGAIATADQLKVLRGLLADRQKDLASRGALIKSEAAQASQQKLLARGAGATGLSLLGVRGATLAASASFLVGAAAVASFAKAIKSAAGLEQEINVFGETAGATTQQMRQAAEEARRLGADITLPAVSAADAAQAFSELAKAGLDVENSLSGARGVLQLATAANIENAEAVQLVASGLNAFSLEGEDATKVADLLTGAANEAQGSISDMGVALQQSAAVARLSGISLEDTVAFLTLLAKNGLRGSDAGTSLRTALTRLIRPTDNAAEALKRLNINIRDANGNIRPDVFDQLTEALSDVSKAQRDATLALIFGQDALRAAAILGREGAVGLNEVRVATQEAGLAARLAGARTAGFAGHVEALRNTVETIGTQIGAAFLPPLSGLVESLERGVSGLGESERAAEAFGGALQGTVGAVRGFSTVVGELGRLGSTILAPLIDTLSLVAQAFGNLGTQAQAGLVGAFVAFRVIQRVDWLLLATRISVVADAIKAVALEMRVATASAIAFRARMAVVSASLFALLTTPTAIAIGIAALAGGLIFLAARETETERATKNLTRANQDLAAALELAATASRTFRDAQNAVELQRIAVIETDLALTRARSALAESRAGRGSAERIQLTTNLRAAVIAHKQAEEGLADSLRQVEIAQQAAAQESINTQRARLDESTAVQRLVDAELRAARIDLRVRPGDEGERARLAEAKAIETVERKLRDLARENRRLNTEESHAQAERQVALANFIGTLDRIPTRREINLILHTGNVEAGARKLANELGIRGEEARRNFINAVLSGLKVLPDRMGIVIREGRAFIDERFAEMGGSGADAFNDAFMRGLRDLRPQIEGELSQTTLSLGTQFAVAGAEGDEGRQLNILRQQLRQTQRRRARLEARFAEAPGPRLEAGIKAQAERETQLQSQIEAIVAGQAREAEERSDKIIQARNKADQAILNSISNKETELQNQLIEAGLKKGLQDDLKVQIRIRNFWAKTVERIKKTIKDAETKAKALLDARGNLLRARQAVREAREAVQEAVAEQQAKIREALELRVEFFNITGNVQGEIRARQRLISHLKKLQKTVKKGSLEYLRLKNEIAREQKAIDELKGQQKEKDRAAQELIFTFLQTQQGFAANLLGNLIPLGATGLVGASTTGGGGPTPKIGPGAGGPGAAGFGGGLGGALIQQAAISSAQGAGPTRGQATVEIDLLRQILTTLREIQRGRAHPEARQQRARGGAAMDVLA